METDIAQLARDIREMWCSERRYFELRTEGVSTDWGEKHMAQWDGGTTSTGKKYAPVWPKIARYCLDRNLNPPTLIRAIFRAANRGFMPQPSHATGDKALQKYNAYIGTGSQLEMKNTLLYKFESQKLCAFSAIQRLVHYSDKTEEVAWRLTLTNMHEPLTPLFRYCAALQRKFADVADMFELDALYQYKRDADLYNEIWGDMIPLKFIQERRDNK